MNFTKITIIILFLIFIFTIPVNADDFELTNFAWVYSDNPHTCYGNFIRAEVSLNSRETYFEIPIDVVGNDIYLSLTIISGTALEFDTYSTTYFSESTITWSNKPPSISLLSSSSGTSIIYIPSATQYMVLKSPSSHTTFRTDDCSSELRPVINYTIPPNICSINFSPDVSISNQSQQYFDYNINSTWDDYYYFIRSIWEPESYNLGLNENWLNINMSGENIPLLYEFTSQSNFSLKLYATTYPTFNLGYAHLIAESPIIFRNSSYIPPNIPEESEEPEIPDPEPKPEPESDYPIPFNQSSEMDANQSINVSWTGEYYNNINGTVDGLCSPIYNFTEWTLSPIYSLNNSIGEFNYYMNESFMQMSEDSSILYESINIIYNAIHPKIRDLITYYLIWVVLLIILKKD
jgi:hypothetical protein